MPVALTSRIIASEFIYEKVSFPQSHASTIVETDDGLLAAWFGGTYESHPVVCIYQSARINRTWNKPELVADGIVNDRIRYSCWNPVFFRRGNVDVILYYKVGSDPRIWWGIYKISKDNGSSWSEPFRVPDNFLVPVRNKPIALTYGSILYPSFRNFPSLGGLY